jgi:hypothetical protein
MTHTAPTSSNSTSGNPGINRSNTSNPQQRTNDSPADRQRLKDAFDKQLQSFDSEDAVLGDLGGVDEGANPFAPIGGLAQRDGNSAQFASATAGVDVLQQAQIERMAAAIAEVRDLKQQTVFSLNFASGTAPVEGALLSLNQQGHLLVQLVGPASGMLPGERQQLARDLEERLKKKKLALQAVRYA